MKSHKSPQSPVTSPQSPVTSHQSPVTSHQSPVTSHLLYQFNLICHFFWSGKFSKYPHF
ncbi:hypothetical protein H5968_10245 [Sphaerospermopsis sp. LEGE 00249]|nr:hypothetical protein [Sphaerospermopsis sp. LEGE 00249]